MAYYAALVSLLELLEEISKPEHPYWGSLPEKHQIVSLYEKFSHLQELLENYPSKLVNETAAPCLGRRIRDATFQAQDIIESHISYWIPRQLLVGGSEESMPDNIVGEGFYEGLENVKGEVDSIMRELTMVHQLHFLNEDQSWELFSYKVFCPIEFEDIGRLIANRCQGLPLAIVVVAGFLSKINKTRHDWGEIARRLVSTGIDQNDDHLSNILSLSYDYLPHHLKPCFLYMGGFPEDYEIHVSKVIKLWVAEGFLRPVRSKSLEEVGEEYLEDLVSRGLVFVTKKGSGGKLKSCSIHDLLRDFCLRKAHYENFLHVHPESTGHARRLFAHSHSSFQNYTLHESLSRVSSIILFCNDRAHSSSAVLCLKLLRGYTEIGDVLIS